MRSTYSFKQLVGFLGAVCLSFALMSTLDEQDAHADVLIGADLNGAFQLGDVSSDSLGFGGNFRLGWQEDFIPVLRLVPEIQVNYMGFAIDGVDADGVTSTAENSRQRMLAARGGLRLGLDFLFGAALYSHVGYGVVDTQGEWAFQDGNGLSFDAGIAFDITAIPFVNLGIHSGYNAFFEGADPDAEPINWLDVGVHVEFVF